MVFVVHFFLFEFFFASAWFYVRVCECVITPSGFVGGYDETDNGE